MTNKATWTDCHGNVYPVVPAVELNLDAESPDYLMAFWARYQRGRNRKDLFPEGGKGTQRATWDLAGYASNKATAMSCRMRGDVNAAAIYENICDRIYRELPAWAKGW